MHKEVIFSHLGLEESYIDQNGKNASKINNGLGQLCKDNIVQRYFQSLALGTASYLEISFFLFYPHPPILLPAGTVSIGMQQPKFPAC